MTTQLVLLSETFNAVMESLRDGIILDLISLSYHLHQLVGLAFEIKNSSMLKKKLSSEHATEDELKYEYCDVQPTATDILMYSYCYIGLLTGTVSSGFRHLCLTAYSND